MTFNFHKALLLCAFGLGSLVATAQTNHPKFQSNDGDRDISGLSIGLKYLSNSVYMGRADSVRTSVITPQLKYTFKPGIYLSGSVDLVPDRKKNKVDGGELATGWDFDITDDLSGGVSYTKYIYSTTSTQVSSAVSSTFNGNLAYNIANIITPTLSADYNINKQGVTGDVFINIGLSHDFEFGDDDQFQISPTIEANTGTQNFYNGYVVYRKNKKAQNSVVANSLLQTYQAELSQYKLLDYEFSIPMEYSLSNFKVMFTPVYALAQNQFKSAAAIKTLGLSGQSAVFYFDLGLTLNF